MIKEANIPKGIIGVIILILVIWGVYYLSNRSASEMVENNITNTSTTTPGAVQNNNSELIEYKSLKGQTLRINIKSDAAIASPVRINGEIKGPWYFEASFPIQIIDLDGKVIAQIPAHATEDWMTTDFVNFDVALNFIKPANMTKGFILLNKDNPSGLPENDDSLKIPVNFK